MKNSNITRLACRFRIGCPLEDVIDFFFLLRTSWESCCCFIRKWNLCCPAHCVHISICPIWNHISLFGFFQHKYSFQRLWLSLVQSILSVFFFSILNLAHWLNWWFYANKFHSIFKHGETTVKFHFWDHQARYKMSEDAFL